MRWLFVLIALLLGGTATWLVGYADTAYRGYGLGELTLLEAQYEAATAAADAKSDVGLSLYLVKQERWRRMAWPPFALGAALCLVLAYRSRSGGVREVPDEEHRLVGKLGSPELLLEGERQKAARLLGVTVDAPVEVIEAALAAQLASRDPSRLEGLAPDLRKVAEEQRAALVRARDLLVKEPRRGSG